MKSNFTRNIALAATAMGVVLTTPALAQEAAEASSADIVVTARRMEERLQDVPISITVYTPEQLSSRNIVNSTDLGTYTPSLSVNGRYGSEKASFAIRGFSQDLNTLPTVGVYFADVVSPRLTSNITSGNGAGVGSMFDLQNVQVLKGPQGTLFGRNTTGGAILLVPQKPTDKLEGYVEGSVGSHNMWRGQAVINIPLSDTIRFRAGVDRYKRDGWLNNLSGVGPKQLNDSNYFAARASLTIDLTPDIENYTVFTYARSHTKGTTGKAVFCNPVAVTPFGAGIRDANCREIAREKAANFGYYDVMNSDPAADLLGRSWQAINTTTWKASDSLTVKNIASFGIAKEAYSFNIEGDYPTVTGQTVVTPFVTTYPGPNGNGQGNQKTFTEEFQLQGNVADSRLIWQAGGYMELSNPIGRQEQYTATLSNCTNVYVFACTTIPGGSVGVAHNNYYYRNYGLYAQATYKLTDQFSITGGIRNTWDSVRETADNIRVTPTLTGVGAVFTCSRATTPTPNPGSALLTNGACGIGREFKTSSSKPTWLIGLDFKPTTDTLLYAKYARGYRAGGVNEANRLAETWKPEFVDTYEIGAKASWGGPVRGNIAVAGFLNKFRDQQVSVFIPQCAAGPANPACTAPAFTGINGIQNVGKSEIKGIEVDGSIFLTEGLRLDVGYAYLDAKVTGAGTVVCSNASFVCSAAVFATKGTILPFAPKNRLTLSGNYDLPLPSDIGTVTVGATFVHTDKYFSNHGDDAAFAAGQIPFNASIAPATDLLNLNLTWKDVGGHPIDLSVFGTNVTNKKYYVSSANGLSSVGADFVIPGEPAMYGARVKIRFGS
ncbi:MAG TPA: TonB-dependent receptor [Novosphingobium sp.]